MALGVPHSHQAFADHTMATAPIGQDRFIPLVQKLSTARAFGFRGSGSRHRPAVLLVTG
jgi:hypothetical protein